MTDRLPARLASASPDTEAFAERLYTRLNQAEIPALNTLRALAVLQVMGGHLGAPVHGLGSGVTFFFILSGFLITWLLLREREKYGDVSIRSFYVRRSLRIFPAFYVFLVVVIGILAVSGKHIAWGH